MAIALKMHKVVKGETLNAIAKKYGLSDSKAIWNAKDNQQIVSRRKKPEGLQPGDVLTIPPTDKQLKENADKLAAAKQMLAANVALQEVLTKRISRAAHFFETLYTLTQKSVADMAKQAAQIEADVNSAKNMALLVDTGVEMMKEWFDKRGNIAEIGAKGTKEGIKAFTDLIKDEIGDAIKEKVDDAITKSAIDAMKKSRIPALEAVAELTEMKNQVWDNLGSPGFWMYTAAEAASKEKLTPLISKEIGSDLLARLAKVQQVHDKHIHGLYELRKSTKAQMLALVALKKGCDDRIKSAQVEIKALL